MSFFSVSHRSSRSRARRGAINTDHGEIQTPTFVPCATKATLKAMTPELITQSKVQLQFVNTYHLAVHPGTELLLKAGGVHAYSRLPTPLLSDSGGFQVFSLGRADRRTAGIRGDEESPYILKLSDDGVKFRSPYDGRLLEFTPESSMRMQTEIGADLVMAFDECTYNDATEVYTKKSMDRTHMWLERCIASMKSRNTAVLPTKNQYLYGIIQGGQYEALRRASSEFISQSEVAGVAIGGVSVGETKEEMRNQVLWCAPNLPAEKPVHLLGVGQFDDIWDLVGHGIDTFDCVEPTRISRMGIVYQWNQVERFMKDRLAGDARTFQKSFF
jgi:tRNA-guanine transglycosylase